MTANHHVVVMGMMGSGKTTIGRAVAERLGVAYVDNDDALHRRTGRDAAAIARDQGAAALHALEHEVLADDLARDDGSVVGAPGSVALDPAAADLLRPHTAVWLRARAETLAARAAHDPARPLLGTDLLASMRALMAEREPGFRRLASVTVDVDDRSVADIADAVVAALRR